MRMSQTRSAPPPRKLSPGSLKGHAPKELPLAVGTGHRLQKVVNGRH